MIERVRYLEQPTPYTCGQTCVAMLTGETVEQVCARLGHDGRTNGGELRALLNAHPRTRTLPARQIRRVRKLYTCGVVFVWRPTYGHWVLWLGDRYHDPDLGVLEPAHAWETWAKTGAQLWHVCPVEVLP